MERWGCLPGVAEGTVLPGTHTVRLPLTKGPGQLVGLPTGIVEQMRMAKETALEACCQEKPPGDIRK